MEDIGKVLLEKIQTSFDSRYKRSSYIQNLLEKIAKGKANLTDAEIYSRTVGKLLSQVLLETITPDVLPNNQLYYNIAQTILEPMLKNNYELVNDIASQVQRSIDQKMNINIKAQKADFPLERINQIVNAVSDQTADWETIRRRLDAPICNVTESFYDDYIQENAKFRNDAGLRCYITRSASANCCNWCSSIAGRYAYSEAPPDVYRRHDNCTCTVTYENGRIRQDVWSKKTWQVKETPKGDYKPAKFSREQAKSVEQKNLQYKGIDNSGRSGIIKLDDMFNTHDDPIREVLGSAEQSHPEKVKEILDYFKSVDVDIIIREENESMGYQPGLSAGKPGQVVLNKNASISAWLHEAQHVKDDEQAGWSGMKILWDNDERYRREKKAYNVEIEFAKQLNRQDMVERLKNLLEDERKQIYNE